MGRLTSDLRAAVQFLLTGLRQIDKTASLFPSSRFLSKAMVSPLPLQRARCVVELGPGTGPITEHILARLPADAHLHAIELDEKLLETTTQRMNDPRLRPHHGSAAMTHVLVRESGCTIGADAVVSSLGLAMMSDALREEILRSAVEVMAPGASFVQYTYPLARALAYQFNQGWSRFNGHKFLQRHFADVASQLVWLNMPPAMVHTCRLPLVTQAASAIPRQRSRMADRRRRRASGARR